MFYDWYLMLLNTRTNVNHQPWFKVDISLNINFKIDSKDHE